MSLSGKIELVTELTVTTNEAASATAIIGSKGLKVIEVLLVKSEENSKAAARAGEQGKGFAVVAVEVRKLASQSAISAGKVRELINGIQEKSKDAVKAMQEGMTIAKEQSKSVIDAKSIFVDILKAIDKISIDMTSIKGYSIVMETEKNGLIEILETLSAST
jgi:methyl-accepting chemotaxis protein